jgi:hypothetical protein
VPDMERMQDSKKVTKNIPKAEGRGFVGFTYENIHTFIYIHIYIYIYIYICIYINTYIAYICGAAAKCVCEKEIVGGCGAREQHQLGVFFRELVQL